MQPSLTLILLVLMAAGSSQARTLSVPSDFRTIQGAIDSANAGDRIVVARGTYRERLKLKPHVAVVAEGNETLAAARFSRAERTVIDCGGDGGIPGVAMAEGSILDGFTVTGAGRYDPDSWQEHWEGRGENQAHSQIGGFGVPAVAVDGVSCRVENCIIRHNGHTGIALRGRKGTSVHPIVMGNRCFRNMGGGIGIMDGAGGIVEGNECYENFWAGIGLSGSAAPLVVGNECHGNVRAGIGVSSGACPIVRRNRCYSNRRAGIGIRTEAATRPVVEDNHCYENGMAGIGISEEAEPILRGNLCEKNEFAGIGADRGAKPILVDNKCRGNSASGIGLNADCEAILWRNVCQGNALVAVGLPERARAILVDNTLSREGGVPPLVAIRGGSEAIVSGNKLTGGGVAGILIEGRAILTDNRIEGLGEKSGQGIWLWNGSGVVGASNSVRGFRVPLVISQDAKWIGARPQ